MHIGLLRGLQGFLKAVLASQTIVKLLLGLDDFKAFGL